MQVDKLQSWLSANSAETFLTYLLERVESQIEEKQTMKKLPPYLADIMVKQIYEIMFPVAMSHTRGNQFVEENWNAIPKITKDNLMPKDVSREKVEQNDYASVKMSSLNFKQISNITKKVSTTSRTMKSVTFTEKRSLRQKKDQSQFSILPIQQNEEDNQVTRLRQKTELRLKYDLQYQKLSLFRQKSFRQKSKILDELAGEEPQTGITHDYEGEHMKSLIADDKIKHYSMRAQFGPMAKRKKQERFNTPIQMSIQINKNLKEKEFANKIVRPMQMPLFSVDHKDFSHMNELKHYKLHEYKKHFGKKYSRLDQYSQTLQLSHIHHKEDHKEQIFSERKHLRDSSMLEASRESVEVKGHVRRLALPRLHGKYKVLDRYDQV